MAGHEVRGVDQVRGLDRLLAKAQVADRDAAGLLGVIGEVGLRVEVGVVADDLDGVLVGADGAVRAEAVEQAALRAFRAGVDLLAQLEGGVGHVVHDAHGEVVLRGVGLEVVEHGLDHRGVELLGAQAVAAADHGDIALARFAKRRAHVQVHRLAQGAGLLGAVEDGDLFGGGRDGGHEVAHRERAVQVHLDEAHLFAALVQVIHGLFDGFAGGTHREDDAVGVFRSVVVKQLVGTAGERFHLLHHALHDGRGGLVELVGGFAALEVDVRVLRGARLLGVGWG